MLLLAQSFRNIILLSQESIVYEGIGLPERRNHLIIIICVKLQKLVQIIINYNVQMANAKLSKHARNQLTNEMISFQVQNILYAKISK